MIRAVDNSNIGRAFKQAFQIMVMILLQAAKVARFFLRRRRTWPLTK